MIERINLICYGLFILILLNDNLTFVKNILFNLIEGMKRKTNGNISINVNKKNILLEFIFWYIYSLFFKLIYYNEYVSVCISNYLLIC